MIVPPPCYDKGNESAIQAQILNKEMKPAYLKVAEQQKLQNNLVDTFKALGGGEKMDKGNLYCHEFKGK